MLGALALFVALGGPSYAEHAIHLIDGSSIKKGSIPLNRLSRDARASLKGAEGPVGPRGLQGPKGERGDAGPGAVKLNASLTAPTAAPVVIATVGPWTVAASCQVPGGFTQGDLRVEGPGNAEYGLMAGANDTGMEPVSGGPALSSSFPEPILTSPTLTNGNFYRAIGIVILDDGTNVAVLEVNFFVDARSVHICRVTGSAIPTT